MVEQRNKLDNASALHRPHFEMLSLLAFPIEKSEPIRFYTFSEQDMSVMKQSRGDAKSPWLYCYAGRSALSGPSAIGR
jgi:hypothetical protein